MAELKVTSQETKRQTGTAWKLAWAGLICGVMAITSFSLLIVESKREFDASNAFMDANDDPGNPLVGFFMLATPALAGAGMLSSLLVLVLHSKPKHIAWTGFTFSFLAGAGLIAGFLYIIYYATRAD